MRTQARHQGAPVVCRSVSELVSTDVAPSAMRPHKSWRSSLSVLPTENPLTTPAGPVTFADLGVPAPLVAVLAGPDILGRAQTGSGKTLGFGIPLVARLADGYTMACRPRGLVLVPTRELATQVVAVLAPLAQAMGLSVVPVFGGTPQGPQVTALRDRADIVVACPGRLADLIEQDHCHLGDVEVSVVDEADHMADLGFLPVVRRLLDATPPEGQRLLFSATLDRAVDVIARRFLNRPARHSVGRGPPPAPSVHVRARRFVNRRARHSVDAAPPPAQIIHHLLTVTAADRVAVVAAL